MFSASELPPEFPELTPAQDEVFCETFRDNFFDDPKKLPPLPGGTIFGIPAVLKVLASETFSLGKKPVEFGGALAFVTARSDELSMPDLLTLITPFSLLACELTDHNLFPYTAVLVRTGQDDAHCFLSCYDHNTVIRMLASSSEDFYKRPILGLTRVSRLSEKERNQLLNLITQKKDCDDDEPLKNFYSTVQSKEITPSSFKALGKLVDFGQTSPNALFFISNQTEIMATLIPKVMTQDPKKVVEALLAPKEGAKMIRCFPNLLASWVVTEFRVKLQKTSLLTQLKEFLVKDPLFLEALCAEIKTPPQSEWPSSSSALFLLSWLAPAVLDEFDDFLLQNLTTILPALLRRTEGFLKNFSPLLFLISKKTTLFQKLWASPTFENLLEQNPEFNETFNSRPSQGSTIYFTAHQTLANSAADQTLAKKKPLENQTVLSTIFTHLTLHPATKDDQLGSANTLH